MYPNLNAEQARFGHTNEYVANFLGLSRKSYEAKKIQKLSRFKSVKNYVHYMISNLNIYLKLICNKHLN